MNIQKSACALGVCVIALNWMACGSSSSSTPAAAPTVSSATISGGNAHALPTAGVVATTGTTNVSTYTTSSVITFDVAMTPTSITNTSGSLTFACAGVDIPVTIAANTANTAFTITPTNPNPAGLAQLSSCTLSLGTSITSAAGVALAATTYTFATGCSSTDSFSNAATIVPSTGCWVASASATPAPSITSGALSVTNATTAKVPQGVYKTFDGTNETVTAVIGTAPTGDNACTLSIADSTAFNGGATLVLYFGSSTSVGVLQNDPAGFGVPVATATGLTAPITLQIAYTASTGKLTLSYADASSTSLTALSTNLTPTGAVGATPIAMLGAVDIGSGAGGTCSDFTDFALTDGDSATNGPTGTTGGQD